MIRMLFLFLFSLSSVQGFDSMKKENVILIHGLMNPFSMSSISTSLRRQNYSVKNWKYPSRSKTIQENADDLVTLLNTYAENKEPIHFVAFSLGGIILKAALNDPNCPSNARLGKITLISSPINGSKLARFIGSFALGRKFLGNHGGKDLYNAKGFDNLGPFPEKTNILVISGTFGVNPVFKETNDGKVSTEESCIDAPHIHKYIHAGHSWICYNTDTINLIIDFLGNTLSEDKCLNNPLPDKIDS